MENTWHCRISKLQGTMLKKKKSWNCPVVRPELSPNNYTCLPHSKMEPVSTVSGAKTVYQGKPCSPHRTILQEPGSRAQLRGSLLHCRLRTRSRGQRGPQDDNKSQAIRQDSYKQPQCHQRSSTFRCRQDGQRACKRTALQTM